MFYTYVLMSDTDGYFYIGYTKDLRQRYLDHQDGKVDSTSCRRPLRLVYYEACIDEEDAKKRERDLKTGYGRRFIKKRIDGYLSKCA